MPQITPNTSNIATFGYSVSFNIQAKTIAFNLLPFTTGGGLGNTKGVAFQVQDQDGVVLASINWSAPQIPNPATTTSYTLSLASLNYAFLFQTYAITVAIQDSNSTIYTVPTIYATICQPNNFQESGYVPGWFRVQADCIGNTLTVQEFTVFIYNNLQPQSVSKTGTLSYPTGTAAAINFTLSLFSNNVIYTGQYRVNCTSVATYALGNDVYVLVSYLTAQTFDITCSSKVSDLLCCISDIFQTKIHNKDNAIGKRAAQQLDDIEIPFFMGLGKEMVGIDSEREYLYIKKYLNCNCGNNAIGQNELQPINPSVYNIVLTNAGGTTVSGPVQTGNTQTWTIGSNVYQVAKGNTADTSFTITTDTSVANTVKYVITFNYANLAGNILTAIGGSQTLTDQLNALISATANIDLTNLNGLCIIDLSSVNYFLSALLPNSSVSINSILIGSNTYNAPGGLLVSNISGVESWLNGLGLGTWQVAFSTGLNGVYFNVLTNNNTNNPVSMSLALPSGNQTFAFQKTNKSLIAFLQAFLEYVCDLTALQVALGTNLSLCQFDYNGDIINVNLSATANTQNDFNVAATNSICNLAARINTLTGVTCAKIQSIFQTNPNAVFNYGTDTYLAIVGGVCTALLPKQQALAFIAAVNADAQTKAAFCAISCATPGTCPDVASVNASAISQTVIGFYGVTWTQTPSANQTGTLYYRLNGSSTWTVASNNINLFPNGNINGTSPYQIVGLSPGQTYQVWFQNNCGGVGFVTTVTTPANTVYSGSFLLDNVIYNICGDSPVTLYSSAPFATGVAMYTNAGLTSLATGYSLIASVTTGHIYNLNSGTAVVGTNTGSTCNSGTAGMYILGNNSGTICSGSQVTLYTNGAFASGLTLFQDSALTTPQTGFAYVVQVSSGEIFNLNSSSGVIGSYTGSSCVNDTVQITSDMVGTQVTGISGLAGFTITSGSFPISPGGEVTGTHTAGTSAISITITGTPSIGGSNVVLTKNGTPIQTIPVSSAGTYTFGSISYLSTDNIMISANT